MGGRILAALDFRFAEPKIEHLYYSYYAQVKRNLLPTAIQVVLIFNLLQLLATCLHLYLRLAGQDEARDRISRQLLLSSLLPLALQFTLLLGTYAMLRLVRKELQLKHLQHRPSSSLEDGNNVTPSSAEEERKLAADEEEDDDDEDDDNSDKSLQGAADRAPQLEWSGKRKSTSLSASLSLSVEPQILKQHQQANSSHSYSSSSSSGTDEASSNNDDNETDEDDDDERKGEDAKLNELELKPTSSNSQLKVTKLKKKNKEKLSSVTSSTKRSEKVSHRKQVRRRKSQQQQQQQRDVKTPDSLSPYKLSLPYILWFCQLLQLASGLPPAHSFISYASLLLYSYTIYVIFPIRLMNCVLLAFAQLAALALLDYLLLLFLGAGDEPNYASGRHHYATTTADHTYPLPQLTSDWSKMLAFVILALATNVTGVMSFFFYERQQRVAFLETRQSLETKLILEQESREQERLLLSILPRHLANAIRKDLGEVVTRQFKKIYMSRHENVSILFADIVGFTAISSNCPAAELVRTLNELFARFDKLAEKYHQLRIKILGDCYYAISGAPIERPDHAVLCVHMGLSMVEAIKSVRERTKSTVDMRVGVHTGGVLAGVLGQRQWQFDVYSKDVELANKMESSGLPGRVHISNATLRFLNDEFELSDGDGHKREEALRLANIRTYFIDRVKKPYPEGTLDALTGTCQAQQPLAVRVAVDPTDNGKQQQQQQQQSKQLKLDATSKTAPPKLLNPASGGGGAGAAPKRRSRDIKRLSLRFANRHLERQFRSTSDIASCISLLGLPVALLCAACAHLTLFGFRLELALTYALALALLLLALLLCVLPYLWRSYPAGAAAPAAPTRPTRWPALVGVARAVKQRAWMKLALTSGMTLVWLCAHSYASLLTTSWASQRRLTGSRDLQLFSMELFNYFAIICSLAITAVTRISFLVKTAIILIVIILQVIMNLSLLSSTYFYTYTQAVGLSTPLTTHTDFYSSSSSSSALSSILSSNSSSARSISSNSSNESSNGDSALGQQQTSSVLPSGTSLPASTFINGSNNFTEQQYVFTLTLATLCWALFLINRQFELTNRRLFLWRKQVEQRKEKVADMRKKNEALVYNILPPNVAKIFLGKRHINDEELYSKSYEAVGVLFAAMPNFSDFYTEESVNNQGLECLRFLNEVISDYDALLDQARFKNIIKIKTMGSTYMAASGLYEGDAREEAAQSLALSRVGEKPFTCSSGKAGEQRVTQSESPGEGKQLSELELCRAKWGHLEQLTEFALALKDTLNNINKDSFNNFVLRIGINQGPITAGVIGVKKPHFDMWGNTVNVASRMESTGRAGSIQVVEETASILRNFGFQFDQRGLVSVKGKGKLMTFYLTGRRKEDLPAPAPPASDSSSPRIQSGEHHQHIQHNQQQQQQQPHLQRTGSAAANSDRLIFITSAKPEPTSDGSASIHLV